ncbi:hypothetical protein MRB53_030989 [Persea americana]|uniref:Uncharacterized protein n=1 Tax=Persea americana TaxID=3435 RepID=A0ACC2KNC4_PERAE|nr:hypothetical protein MRB53_030989 [Persea americana]
MCGMAWSPAGEERRTAVKFGPSFGDLCFRKPGLPSLWAHCPVRALFSLYSQSQLSFTSQSSVLTRRKKESFLAEQRTIDRSIDRRLAMASTVDTVGDPIPTSAVLMASSKHIATSCRAENVAFLQCKKNDPNPEKCLDKGQQVTRCVLSLLKGLHQRCSKEMDAYAGCMYYHTNEFELCRKEQREFESACPWSE